MAASEILAVGVGLVSGCVLFREKLDPRRIFDLSVKVNCWFCCNDAKVPYSSKKAWICPRRECSQFNGFDDDGGYNTEIADQHINPDETVGRRKVKYTSNSSSLATTKNCQDDAKNGLCRTCNLNQDLKIHQLRTFKARNDADYDEEIQEFAAHLERTYRLCRYCEASLHQKLGEQDSWLKPQLLGWKLEKNRQTPLTSSEKFIASGYQKFLSAPGIISFILRIVLILGALVVSFIVRDLYPLPKLIQFAEDIPRSVGTLAADYPNVLYMKAYLKELCLYQQSYTQLNTIISLRKDWVMSSLFALVLSGFCYFYSAVRNSFIHQVCIASWVAITIQVLSSERKITQIADSVVATIALSCVVTSLCVSVKGFNTRKRKSYQPHAACHRKDNPSVAPEWQWNSQETPGEDLEDTLTQDLVSTSTPVGSIVASTYNSSPSMIQIPNIAPSRLNLSNDFNPNTESFATQQQEFRGEKQIFGSPCDISTLKIGSDQAIFTLPDRSSFDTASVASGAFSLKQYDGNNSGINFGEYGLNGCRKGPLIKPPKFNASSKRGVAQSSWVAGGYWLNNKFQQNKINSGTNTNQHICPKTISRSSSQSSGFISYSGQAQISRNTSNLRNKTSEVIGELSMLSPPYTSSELNRGPLFKSKKVKNGFSESIDQENHKSAFSLNPIGDQLAFFDTSFSTERGTSRPCSPSFISSKGNQPNAIFSDSRDHSRISNRFFSVNSNNKDLDNVSFNSSLDKLTQEGFSELQPKAESSPKNLLSNQHNKVPCKNSWMEHKITINISFYSVLLLVSVAVNVGLLVYFMS